MIRIITIAREYGSGGAEVGRKVAESLGWEFLDGSLIQKIAAVARVPASVAREYDERPSSRLERFAAGFRFAASESYASGRLEIADANSMRALTEHVIRTAADIGSCVVVGRGSQCILRDRDDALHVFVYAPIKARMQRLNGRFSQERDLRDTMADIDRERATYIHQHYGRIWDDICLYDLCVNTARGTSIAAALVLKAAGVIAGPAKQDLSTAVARPPKQLPETVQPRAIQIL